MQLVLAFKYTLGVPSAAGRAQLSFKYVTLFTGVFIRLMEIQVDC